MAPGCHCLALSLVGRQLLHFWAGLAHSHGAPARRARLAMAPGCHCQQLLTRAGFAHSHGAPRQDARLAMAPGCDCLALPLVGVAAASLLTRTGFAHSHTYMPGHGAPARAVAAFLSGSNSLPPVLAMSSAGDGARVWHQEIPWCRYCLADTHSSQECLHAPAVPQTGPIAAESCPVGLGRPAGTAGRAVASAKICRLYNSPGGSRCRFPLWHEVQTPTPTC